MPIRWSRPIPRATSSTSAPVSSQTLAISLMNEIFVARNALAASLIISALAMSVRTSGAPSGAYSSTTASPAQSPTSPTTTRSGLRKSSSADPSLRNSGHDTYENPDLPLLVEHPPDRVPRCRPARSTSSRARGRRRPASQSTTACTADRSASPEYVGGVPTATNSSRACSSAGASSVEKCRRSPLACDRLGRGPARRSGSRRASAGRSCRRRCRRTRPRCRARRSRQPSPGRHIRCRSRRSVRGLRS